MLHFAGMHVGCATCLARMCCLQCCFCSVCAKVAMMSMSQNCWCACSCISSCICSFCIADISFQMNCLQLIMHFCSYSHVCYLKRIWCHMSHGGCSERHIGYCCFVSTATCLLWRLVLRMSCWVHLRMYRVLRCCQHSHMFAIQPGSKYHACCS